MNLKNWKIWPPFRRKFLCDKVGVYQNPANMNPFWYFSFRNWSHFQIISSFIATRRYLDQVTKKHLQIHKVQYFQPMGLENFQIEWPPKQNLHYLEGVKILLLCKARLRTWNNVVLSNSLGHTVPICKGWNWFSPFFQGRERENLSQL